MRSADIKSHLLQKRRSRGPTGSPAAASRRLPVLRLAAFLILATISGLAVLQPVQPAAAQERVERKSFLQLLFGGGGQTTQKAAPEVSRTSRVKTAPSPRSIAPPPEPVVEKLDNARKILVVGDFLANGTADGLTVAFSQAPGVVVVDRTNGSSGLVRDDYYDWPGQV